MRGLTAAVLLVVPLCAGGCSMKAEAERLLNGKRGGSAPSNASTIASEILKANDGIVSVEVAESEDPILFVPGKPETVTVNVKDMGDAELAALVVDVQETRLNWLDDDARMVYVRGGETVYECGFNEELNVHAVEAGIAEGAEG